jgi:carboxypeptidase T
METRIKYPLFIFFLVIAIQVFAQQEQYSRVEILFDDQHSMEFLGSLGLEIEHGQVKRNHSFTSDFSASELALLRQYGFQFNVQIEDVSQFYSNQNNSAREGGPLDPCGLEKAGVPQNFSLGSMGGYFTLNELLAQLDSMHSRYPHLINAKAPISNTLLTQGNRPLYWVRISDNPDVDETGEPEILMTALHHAREPMSLSQLVFYMWYLLENYETNTEVRQIVNATELYLIPCLNPDGYAYNQQIRPNGGGLWRKNRRPNGGGQFGVDLNRNYGKFWGFNNSGSSPSPSSETYRGPSAFSEPETRLVKQFCEEHTFQVALNNHSYSNVLIYPYGHLQKSEAPDSTEIRGFAETLCQENHFYYGTVFETINYTSNGGSDPWMYGDTTGKPKIFAFTPEMGEPGLGFWPPADYITSFCANQVFMNLKAQKLTLPYGTVFDDSPYYFDEPNEGNIPFRFARLGLVTDTFTIEAIPIQNIAFTDLQPFSVTNPGLEDTLSSSYSYQLPAGLSSGDTIRYAWHIKADTFSWNDTITRIYGDVEILISDSANNLNQWTTSGTVRPWGVSSRTAHSLPSSFSDSPTGNYAGNELSSIEYSEPVNLIGFIDARLEFFGWWETEQYADHLRIQFKPELDDWVDQCAEWTTIYPYEPTNDNGPFIDNRTRKWRKQTVSLTPYTGEKISVRFLFRSDTGAEEDGVYIDDIKLSGIKDITTALTEETERGIVVFPNPSSDEFTVKFERTGDFQLRLTDLSGKELNRWSGFGDQKQISIPGLRAGIYLLEIRDSSNKKEVRKICVI